jgi:putative transposase
VGIATLSYRGFRFPAEIISHCVWLYHRFPLSFREVEEMMLRRGIVVSHEIIRQWSEKFGQTYANGLRRQRTAPPTDCAADGHAPATSGTSTRCSSRSTVRPHYLWRAVDQHGTVAAPTTAAITSARGHDHTWPAHQTPGCSARGRGGWVPTSAVGPELGTQ